MSRERGWKISSREKGIVERMETLRENSSTKRACDTRILQDQFTSGDSTKTAVSGRMLQDINPDALSKALHMLHRDLTSTICKLIEVCAGK